MKSFMMGPSAEPVRAGFQAPLSSMPSDTLDIIFQDDLLVAVNKPAGLLVHPSLIDRRETRFAMKLLRNQLGRWVYPVHRLDKPTSGVLLFALNPETARSLGENFDRQQVRKTYLAVVRGYTEPEGRIDHPLREKHDKMTDRRARQDKEAQPAVTEYRRLAGVELPYAVDRYATSRYSLLAVHPKTGRKHQIRRHLKHIAHPVVGDTTHGKSLHNRLFRERLGSGRLLLAAVEMEFDHPRDGRPLRLVAPLDETFTNVLRQLGWEQAVPVSWLTAENLKATEST